MNRKKLTFMDKFGWVLILLAFIAAASIDTPESHEDMSTYRGANK